MADNGDKGNPKDFGGKDPAGDDSDPVVQDAQVAVSGNASNLRMILTSGEEARRRRGKGDGGKGNSDQDRKEK